VVRITGFCKLNSGFYTKLPTTLPLSLKLQWAKKASVDEAGPRFRDFKFAGYNYTMRREASHKGYY
jgi:hypothetical protein